MAVVTRAKPYTIDWPPTPEKLENINEMLQQLYDDLAAVNVKPTTTGGGATGLQGLPGMDGNDGDDSVAFPIPGIQGVAGPPGLHGLPGDDGDEGPSGLPGVAGAAGATGAQGLPGYGIPGIDGEDGMDWFIPGPTGAAGAGSAPTEYTTTTTGNIDDLDFSNANIIRMNNATLSTIRGLKAGTAGQQVTIVSIGAGQVDLAHQNASDGTAANRLINFATSASTSLAAGVGTATYQYDATTARWRLVAHHQGDWIAQAYASGDFTGSGAMTWTVESGDVLDNKYWLKDRTLFLWVALTATAIGGVPATALQQLILGGFSFGGSGGEQARLVIQITDNAVQQAGLVFVSAGTTISYYKDLTTTAVWVAAPGIFANFPIPVS